MLCNDTLGIYCFGVGVTAKLQHTFSQYEHFLLLCSHIGDPRYAFLLLFPLTYFFDHYFGLKVIWTSALTEWLNAILKWIARDDRPYWWTSHDCVFNGRTLKQFSITCESGPGFPSGHVMSTSSLGLLLIIYLHNHSTTKAKKMLLYLIIILYVALVVLVSVSRVYIATHFPHQVVAGALIGVTTAYTVHTTASKYSPQVLLTTKALLFGFLLLTIALVLYYILMLLQLDPLSSVDAALRYCQHREWVHLDTTLFFAVIRDTGSLVGVGVAAGILTKMPSNEPCAPSAKTFSQCCISVIAGLSFCFLFSISEKFQLSASDMFYVYAMVKYMLYTSVVIVAEYLLRVRYLGVGVEKKKLYLGLCFIACLLVPLY